VSWQPVLVRLGTHVFQLLTFQPQLHPFFAMAWGWGAGAVHIRFAQHDCEETGVWFWTFAEAVPSPGKTTMLLLVLLAGTPLHVLSKSHAWGLGGVLWCCCDRLEIG
jgi:hypothetical protein